MYETKKRLDSTPFEKFEATHRSDHDGPRRNEQYLMLRRIVAPIASHIFHTYTMDDLCSMMGATFDAVQRYSYANWLVVCFSGFLAVFAIAEGSVVLRGSFARFFASVCYFYACAERFRGDGCHSTNYFGDRAAPSWPAACCWLFFDPQSAYNVVLLVLRVEDEDKKGDEVWSEATAEARGKVCHGFCTANPP